MKLNIKVREIMKGKLYETLIGTDARLAITISGEELKEFIEDVMADARLRAESEIKAKQSEECIDKGRYELRILLSIPCAYRTFGCCSSCCRGVIVLSV